MLAGNEPVRESVVETVGEYDVSDNFLFHAQRPAVAAKMGEQLRR